MADNPWSSPERALHLAFRRAGVRGWLGNAPVLAGGRLWYPDVLFEDLRLIVEIDGHAHHSTDAQRDADRRRQNLLVEARYTVLRFTPRQIADEPLDLLSSVSGTMARLAGHPSSAATSPRRVNR